MEIPNTLYSKIDYVKFQNKGGNFCAYKEGEEVNSNLDECVKKKKKKPQNNLEPALLLEISGTPLQMVI